MNDDDETKSNLGIVLVIEENRASADKASSVEDVRGADREDQWRHTLFKEKTQNVACLKKFVSGALT